MTLDLQSSPIPKSPVLAPLPLTSSRPHSGPPTRPRAKKPPPILAKNPPPSKPTLAATHSEDEVAASKLHWIPIPDMKVKGTVWEVIGRDSRTEGSSTPPKFYVTKRASTCEQVSPRAVITGDSDAYKAYPRFVVPEEILKQHFFKPNPKKTSVKNVTINEKVSKAAPRPAKERTSESVLSNARLQSISICLKGLRLDGVNKIVTSLEALFDCLQSIEFGAISQESLAKHTITPRPVEAIAAVASGAPTSKEELYQITTHRHNRLLSREDLALIAESWPTNEEAKKLMALKQSDDFTKGHPVDLFLIQLLDNASIQTKIEALLCRIQVELETRRLLKILAKVMKCCELLIEGLAPRGVLSRILESVLALGNKLNNTDVRGFKVKSLEKLKDCRSHKAKEVSLLNVIAMSVLDSGVSFESLQREITALASILKDVSEIDLNQTAADLGAVASRIGKAQRDLIAANSLFGLSCSPKSLSSCSSTKDSWQSVVSDSDGGETTFPCTEENVIQHLASFTRWAEGIVAILQKHFFLSKDRLATICKLLGETDDKVINGVVEALSLFLSNLVQACKVEYGKRTTANQHKGGTSIETARIRPRIALPPINPFSEVWTVDLDKASFDEVFDLLNVPLSIDDSDDNSCPFTKLGINRSWTSRAEELAPRSLLRSRVSHSKGSLKLSTTMSRGDHARPRSVLQVHQNVIAISSDGAQKETISPVFSVDLPLSTGTPSELTTPMSCYYDNTRLNTRSFNLQPLCAACDLMRAWNRAENYGDVLMTPSAWRGQSNSKPSLLKSMLLRLANTIQHSLTAIQQYVGTKLRLQVPQEVVRDLATKLSSGISVEPPDNLSLDCLTPTVKKKPMNGGELKRVKLISPSMSESDVSSPASGIYFTPLNEVIRVRHVRCQKQLHMSPESPSTDDREFETPTSIDEGLTTWTLFQRYGPSFERVSRL